MKFIIGGREFEAIQRTDKKGRKYLVVDVIVQEPSSLWGPNHYHVPIWENQIEDFSRGLIIRLVRYLEGWRPSPDNDLTWFPYGRPFNNTQLWVSYQPADSGIKVIYLKPSEIVWTNQEEY